MLDFSSTAYLVPCTVGNVFYRRCTVYCVLHAAHIVQCTVYYVLCRLFWLRLSCSYIPTYYLFNARCTMHTHAQPAQSISGRWQAPAAVLPEGPKEIGYERASPRARGRAELNVRFGACQCYYMFFTTQLKIVNFTA